MMIVTANPTLANVKLLQIVLVLLVVYIYVMVAIVSCGILEIVITME